MHYVKPKVIRLAQTALHHVGVVEMLATLGVSQAQANNVIGAFGDISPGEQLIELAGRLCYRSFEPGLNLNVTKVRQGNAEYIANILRQKHYSVLEHVNITYAFLNVSRVFTHELVRHRLASPSQESLRYVRLDELGAYYPEAFGREVLEKVASKVFPSDTRNQELWIDTALGQSRATFEEFFIHAEEVQRELAGLFHLDEVDFETKKNYTIRVRAADAGAGKQAARHGRCNTRSPD